MIESDTILVHTIMFADGDTMTNIWRRAPGTIEWTPEAQVRVTATTPTRLKPRGTFQPEPAHCAADNYLGT